MDGDTDADGKYRNFHWMSDDKLMPFDFYKHDGGNPGN